MCCFCAKYNSYCQFILFLSHAIVESVRVRVVTLSEAGSSFMSAISSGSLLCRSNLIVFESVLAVMVRVLMIYE